MILGRNAAARELGMSPQGLGKAFTSGRVTKTADGLYDVDACREQMKRNSNPIKQASGRAQQRTAAKPGPKHSRRASPVDAMPPEDDSRAVDSAPEYDEPTDGLRAITIKREMLKLKKERREFRLEGRRLVDGRKVRSETIERAANERQALLNIPKRWSPAFATELGVEERKVYGVLSKLVREFLTERSSGPAVPVVTPEFSSGMMAPPATAPAQMGGAHA